MISFSILQIEDIFQNSFLRTKFYDHYQLSTILGFKFSNQNDNLKQNQACCHYIEGYYNAHLYLLLNVYSEQDCAVIIILLRKSIQKKSMARTYFVGEVNFCVRGKQQSDYMRVIVNRSTDKSSVVILCNV